MKTSSYIDHLKAKYVLLSSKLTQSILTSYRCVCNATRTRFIRMERRAERKDNDPSTWCSGLNRYGYRIANGSNVVIEYGIAVICRRRIGSCPITERIQITFGKKNVIKKSFCFGVSTCVCLQK